MQGSQKYTYKNTFVKLKNFYSHTPISRCLLFIQIIILIVISYKNCAKNAHEFVCIQAKGFLRTS